MVRNFLSAFQFAHAFVQGPNYTIGVYVASLLPGAGAPITSADFSVQT